MASNPRVKAWQADALWQLKGINPYTGAYPVAVTMLFSFSDNRRHDLDNVCSSILDILCKSGIFVDDDYRHICPLTLDCVGVDKANPKVEIYIQEIQET